MKRLNKLAMAAVLGLGSVCFVPSTEAGETLMSCEQAFSFTELAKSDLYKSASPSDAKGVRDAFIRECEAAARAGKRGVDLMSVLAVAGRTAADGDSEIDRLGNDAHIFMAIAGWKLGQLSK